ncbi:MAG: 50S ribosomal protein L9 [Alphaproteobacteria bacterium]|nr:MAG: 50S ribosomal protein L9 [Alphaproteobacteria bacterium]
MKKSTKYLEVILQERIRGLGAPGDVVKVRRGYAVNYLLPKDIAEIASTLHMENLVSKRAELAKRDEQLKQDGKVLKEKLDKVVINIEHNTVDGFRLHGSISDSTIIKELSKLGFDVSKNNIVMKPIKEIGSFTVQVHTYGDHANVVVNVTPPRVVE